MRRGRKTSPYRDGYVPSSLVSGAAKSNADAHVGCHPQGAWAGKGAKKSKNARKFVKKIDGVDASQRKDAKLNHVIISERKDKKAAKYMLKDLPFPYTSAAQHEHKLRTPMGPEWSTSTVSPARYRLHKRAVHGTVLLSVWQQRHNAPFLTGCLYTSFADLARPNHSRRARQAWSGDPTRRSQGLSVGRSLDCSAINLTRACVAYICMHITVRVARRAASYADLAGELPVWEISESFLLGHRPSPQVTLIIFFSSLATES